jgi:hypothetical protein
MAFAGMTAANRVAVIVIHVQDSAFSRLLWLLLAVNSLEFAEF